MKITFLYGLIAGILMATVDGLNYFYLYNKGFGKYSILVNILILIIAIVMGIRHLNKSKYENQIKYTQATSSGILISVHAGWVMGLLVYIFYSIGNQEFISYIVQQTEKSMLEKKYSAEEIEKMITQLKAGYSPFKQLLYSLQSVFILGVVISLIAGAVLKKGK